MRLWAFLKPVKYIGLSHCGLARLFCTLFLYCIFVFPSVAETVYFTSLEWPPYSGVDLVSQGHSIDIARQAFASEGVGLAVDFLPWARAVRLARTPSSKYLGYLPEYFSEELMEHFYFSDPVGVSPLGFVERKDQPVFWRDLSDLRNYKIGVVRDYVNTKEFDAKVAAGELHVYPVSADILNLRKVLAGRLELAVVDKHVMQYWLKRDKQLLIRGAKLQFNERLLGRKKLYVCLKRSADGERYLRLFNRGLKSVVENMAEGDWEE